MVVLLMGVSGSGKTTVGKLLAIQLGWEFTDADNYHSAANVKKMQSGIPLTDADRTPWLDAVRGLISEWIAAEKNGVLACSALKRSYRDILVTSPAVKVVYLKGSPELLSERLRARVGHFMTEQMLASQLATLEEPENAIVIEVDQSTEEIVNEIRGRLGLP
jgi:gluconokinase